IRPSRSSTPRNTGFSQPRSRQQEAGVVTSEASGAVVVVVVVVVVLQVAAAEELLSAEGTEILRACLANPLAPRLLLSSRRSPLNGA
ncbi:MAG TPA: hypothetical protein VFG14_17250, partial [Chthoniobacteraceae bacterium]|nr:hypothetical protein [Chthoniobacteraceae bacterium]